MFAVTGLTSSVFGILYSFSPFVFGAWAALSGPGKHLFGYASLALLPGVLNLTGELVLELLGGWAGLPTGPVEPDNPNSALYAWIASIDAISLRYAVATLFFTMVAMFAAGGIFGDLIKPKKFSERGKRSRVYRALDAVSRQSKDPNPLVVAMVEKIPDFLKIIIGLILILAGYSGAEKLIGG